MPFAVAKPTDKALVAWDNGFMKWNAYIVDIDITPMDLMYGSENAQIVNQHVQSLPQQQPRVLSRINYAIKY